MGLENSSRATAIIPSKRILLGGKSAFIMLVYDLHLRSGKGLGPGSLIKWLGALGIGVGDGFK